MIRGRNLLPLLVLLAPLTARAWDPEIHLSMTRGALRISALAEARTPLDFREAVLHDVARPDLQDKDCRYHCSMAEPRDPAQQAEQTLGLLTNRKVSLTAYQRAQMIGRYLHYVEDAVSLPAFRGGAAEKYLNFFANQDFVFWREPRPLKGPLAAALRERAKEAEWANLHQVAANPAIFRLAVNTAIDALLLVPPLPGEAAAGDGGPVVFVVNRIDNGSAGKATAGEWKGEHAYGSSDSRYGIDSSGGYTKWSWDPGSKGGGQDFKKADLMEREGLQVADMSVREEANGVRLRIVFFNNSPLCATNVSVKASGWSWSLPDTIPAKGILAVEALAPRSVLSARIQKTSRQMECSGPMASAAVSSARRMVYGNGGAPPLFDAALQEIDISRGSDRVKGTSNFTPPAE